MGGHGHPAEGTRTCSPQAVRVEAVRVEAVRVEAVINAAHAIDEGDVEHQSVTVRTWGAGAEVCAEVVDTGKGIAPADLPRIFEPFFTTKPTGLGSGLGLSVCQGIVSELGGTLRAESPPGGGARFIVALPATVSAVEEPALACPASVRPVAVRGRVLVVDDEAGLRRALVRMLTPTHEVVTAASGAEARALLEGDAAFDLILCDVMMAEMTGVDLHEWLAIHAPLLARRVVFMTGGAFTGRAAEYLARMENTRIDKPFDAQAVGRLVARLVAAGHGRP